MAKEIEFSIMAPDLTGIQPLLDRFETQVGFPVHPRLLSWDTAWSTLVRAALYKDGPNVSEVGTTWVGDLIGMNALRPFNAAEVAALGKASAFFPSAWKTTTQDGGAHIWSIPWMVGSRLIYVKPELFERAGLDPQVVFRSIEAFEETVRKLHEAGVQVPWTVPTGQTHTTLLSVSSWVWAAGGDFLTADGKSTRFMEPEALAGLNAYFRLARFLAPRVQHLNGLEPDLLFLSDPETAMTISGPWLFCDARLRSLNGAAQAMAVTLPPGPSFVGGSNLVIWKYSPSVEDDFRLIRYLTQPEALVPYSQHVGLLPARLEALADSPFAADPFWQTAIRGLQTGKTFPTIRLWGMVEDRLRAGLSAVWEDVLADPLADPQTALVRRLGPIASRLDPLLKQG